MKVPDFFEWCVSLPKWLFGGESGKRNRLLVWALTAIVAFVGGYLVLFQVGVDIGFIK